MAACDAHAPAGFPLGRGPLRRRCASRVAVSQSTHSWARKPVPAESFCGDHPVTQCFRSSPTALALIKGSDAGVGICGGWHLGGCDPAVAQALRLKTRPPTLGDVDATGLTTARRHPVSACGSNSPLFRDSSAVLPEFAVPGARSAAPCGRPRCRGQEPIKPDEPAIATTALAITVLNRPRTLPLRGGA